MKKNICKILFVAALLSVMLCEFSTPRAYAQKKKLDLNSRDTVATLVIDGAELTSSNEMTFKLRLLRNSDLWTAYANGTYEFEFSDDAVPISTDSLMIEFTGVSDLKQYISTGDEMPIDGYIIKPAIANKRFSIMIAGPEKYSDALFVPKTDSGVVLGEFKITGKNGFLLPERLKWSEPYDFLQACAYKLEADSLLAPGVVWKEADANLEMVDSLNHYVVFKSNNGTEPQFILDWFRVEYEGQKKVNISWKTSSEPYNQGFILSRGMRTNAEQLPKDVNYTDVIASYPPDIDYKGTGTAGLGGLYFKQDTVPYRGIEYCYKLEYQKKRRGSTGVIYLDSKCLEIPNAVIYAADATPNPFQDETQIRFWLEDDCYIKAFVNDIAGRDVYDFCDGTEYKFNMGSDPHIFNFSANSLSSNGLYEVVIIATPINDKSVTNSRAVIKLQLLR